MLEKKHNKSHERDREKKQATVKLVISTATVTRRKATSFLRSLVKILLFRSLCLQIFT